MTYDEKPNLPHCVIFDIDGTLALKGNRSPYDWARVGEDTPNKPIVRLFQDLGSEGGYKMIVFSGRDGSCRDATDKWLTDHQIYYSELYMRPAGNNEKDSIIKKRMFEEHIRGKFYCDFVVDDRNQVVKMWREELGLTCLQVAEGDF